MSDSTALLVGALLLLLNAFFVGSEFAVISARRSQVEPAANAGSRAAGTALQAMENVSLMLACCQLGITVCSLGLGAIAEPALAHLLEVPFEALGMPDDMVHAEAEVLEHHISEELEELIAAKLGEPSHDPHGTPIPGPDLRLPVGDADER